MRMKFFKLTKPAAPEVIEMEDLANMTDDDAVSWFTITNIFWRSWELGI